MGLIFSGVTARGVKVGGSSEALPPGTPYFWVDGSYGITKGTGDNVTQWNDRSGNGYHLTQTDGSTCPTAAAADTKNGRQVVNFNATNTQFMNVTSTPTDPTNAAYTVAMVCYWNAGQQAVGLTTNNHWIIAHTTGDSIYCNASDGGFDGYTGGTSGWFIVVAQMTGASRTTGGIWQNGSEITGGNDAWSPADYVLRYFGGWTPSPNCKFAEYILWNTASVSVSDINTYLNNKWAVY